MAIGDPSLLVQRAAATADAVTALIAWRLNWERKHPSPPSVQSGHEDEIELWQIAGRLMDLRGIQRMLP
jgi:hypothetical protein